MKIRTGFVSNSSSSSFIVAFSKKPTNVAEVMTEMFPNDPNGVVPNPWPGSNDHDEGLSHSQIVVQVLDDIQKESKKLSKKDLLDELSGRYFMLNDKLYCEGAPYYALNSKLANEYVDAHNTYEQDRRHFDDVERALILKHVGRQVQYAYKGGTNWSTKQPFTDAEIETYEQYAKKEKAFKDKSKEYIALEKKQRLISNQYYTHQRTVANKLARIDLKKFLNDNKGKFIARFTYSDNDGTFFSLMEHSNIFRNLSNIYVSHH